MLKHLMLAGVQNARSHRGEPWGLLNLLDLDGERPRMRDVMPGRRLEHQIKDYQPPLEATDAVSAVRALFSSGVPRAGLTGGSHECRSR